MKIDIESIQTQMNGNKKPARVRGGVMIEDHCFSLCLIRRNLSKFMLQRPVVLQFAKLHH